MKATKITAAALFGASIYSLIVVSRQDESITPDAPSVPSKTSRIQEARSGQAPRADQEARREHQNVSHAAHSCSGCTEHPQENPDSLLSIPIRANGSGRPQDRIPITAGGPRELGELTPGREALVMDAENLRALRDAKRDQRVTLTFAGGTTLSGRVTMANQNPKSGWWIRSVALDSHPNAVFTVDHQPDGRLGGQIYSQSSESAFLVTSNDEGQAVFKQIARTDLLPDCRLIAEAPEGVEDETPSGTVSSIPMLNSLPGASKVLYLDFDGELVSGTVWNSNHNGGNAIDAQDPGLDEATITRIWESISEDYRPFTANVTTDRDVYDAAAQSDRMMLVFTPTNAWYGSAGGVAYLSSFGNQSYQVCWVFTNLVYGTHNKAMAGSHEFGHTLSLRHDGDTTTGSGYHSGLGSGDVSWGPIMGAPYGRSIVQWNAGDYLGADNTEDDVALITNYLGRRTDDFSDTHTSALPIGTDGTGTVTQSGIISDRNDLDVFRLSLNAGQINLTVRPHHPFASSTEGVNLDVQARLLDSSGNELVSERPYGTVEASINRTVTAGTYYLEIDGTWESGSNGYSDYGSLGQYFITGTIPSNGTTAPTLAVTGNGIPITSGDSTPDTSDGTDYGTVVIGSGGSTHEFVLHNTGTGDLSVTQISVSTGEFSTNVTGLPWTIGAADTRTVQITFDPGSDGEKFATVSVTHSGEAPSPHTFTVRGLGETGGSGDDAYEPNNSLAAAYSLRYDEQTWLSALHGTATQSDDDWYEINVTSGYEKVQIHCSFIDAEGDVDIALHDAAGTFLTSSTSTSNDEFIEFVTPTSGTHYIRVYYGNRGNRYDLWWDDLPNDSVADDHGDNPGTATTLSPVTPMAGTIGHGGDTDWFVFDLTEASVVIASTTGSTDTYGTLLTETDFLASNDDSGEGLNFRLLGERLEPGRYYIEVRGYNSSTLGDYVLTLRTASLTHFGIAHMSRNHTGSTNLAVMTEPGRSYSIQRSTNLAAWQTVATGIEGSSFTVWTDNATTSMPKAYYRTILE